MLEHLSHVSVYKELLSSHLGGLLFPDCCCWTRACMMPAIAPTQKLRFIAAESE